MNMGILPSCKDPSLTTLKKKGYNIVQLPRVDLLPTQLLVERKGRLQRMGELASVFVVDPNGPGLPPIKPDKVGPNISGTQSADLDIGIGLNILGGLISALGGSTLGISYAYAKASTIQFEFSSTLETSTELALVDQFLFGSKINPYARAVADMLNDDKVYVVTSTLKSNKISVTAKDSGKQSIGIDLPVIQNAIGANVKVGGNQASSGLVTFEGAVPLVFGFQAVQLVFDNGKYRTMKLVDAGTVVAEAIVRAETDGDAPAFLRTDGLLMDGA